MVSVKAGLGLLPRIERLDRVSTLMRARDEKLWIKPSTLSIKDLVNVNKYLIIDASTDKPCSLLG